MKWSVALLGHYKYRYELREKELSLVKLSLGTNFQGIEQFKEIWIHKTISRHINPPSDYDDNLYFVYECTGWEQRAQPGDIIAYQSIEEANRWTPTEHKEFLIVTIEGDLFKNQLSALCESQWDTDSYPVLPDPIPWDKINGDIIELRPTRYIRKRRFSLPLDILEGAGVDLQSMTDKELIYTPTLRNFDKLECFDNLNSRTILESDGLNLLEPIIIRRPE